MKSTFILALLTLVFSVTVSAHAATKIIRSGPNSVITTQSGHEVFLFNRGVAVKSPRLNCSLQTDCLGFCGEVCDTGQVDTCFCGGQSFPCEDINLPPVCDTLKK